MATRDWRLIALGTVVLGLAAYFVGWWAVIVVWVLWILTSMVIRRQANHRTES